MGVTSMVNAIDMVDKGMTFHAVVIKVSILCDFL